MEENREKFDYKTLSITKQHVWKFCKQILRDLKNGECTDEQVSSFISSVDAEKHGYINPEDYLPAEKAMKFVGVHRNMFFSLTKQYGIQCKKINGHSIGYHRSDLQKIKNTLKA